MPGIALHGAEPRHEEYSLNHDANQVLRFRDRQIAYICSPGAAYLPPRLPFTKRGQLDLAIETNEIKPKADSPGWTGTNTRHCRKYDYAQTLHKTTQDRTPTTCEQTHSGMCTIQDDAD